jgi:hypothetical protein
MAAAIAANSTIGNQEGVFEVLILVLSDTNQRFRP